MCEGGVWVYMCEGGVWVCVRGECGCVRGEDDTCTIGSKRGTNVSPYVIKLERTPAFTKVFARQRPVKMARERRSSSENAFRKRRILRISSSSAFWRYL